MALKICHDEQNDTRFTLKPPPPWAWQCCQWWNRGRLLQHLVQQKWVGNSVRKRIQRKADKPWGKQILTNSTSKQLHEIKRFSKNKSYANNNNDTLGGVGNTL